MSIDLTACISNNDLARQPLFIVVKCKFVSSARDHASIRTGKVLECCQTTNKPSGKLDHTSYMPAIVNAQSFQRLPKRPKLRGRGSQLQDHQVYLPCRIWRRRGIGMIVSWLLLINNKFCRGDKPDDPAAESLYLSTLGFLGDTSLTRKHNIDC